MLWAILCAVLGIEIAVLGYRKSSLRALAVAPRKHLLDAALMFGSAAHPLLLLTIGTGGIYFASLWAAAHLPHVTLALPAIPAATAYAVLIDFLFYWMHRLFHTRWLWPIHKLHHVDRPLTPLVAFRFHPLNAAFDPLWRTVPAILFGVSPQMAAAVLMIEMAQGFVAHSRLPWNLSPWLVGPREHAIHHSPKPEHHDKNFGGQLLIWDRLFGTWAQDLTMP